MFVTTEHYSIIHINCHKFEAMIIIKNVQFVLYIRITLLYQHFRTNLVLRNIDA